MPEEERKGGGGGGWLNDLLVWNKNKKKHNTRKLVKLTKKRYEAKVGDQVFFLEQMNLM